MIRVFPRKTKWTPIDNLAFVGDPPLFRPPDQPVRISVTFTWDIPEAMRLYNAWRDYYTDVQLGGPAFDDPGGEFTLGQFIKEGVTITSRGCPKHCPWCFVPKREGPIRELEIKPGWIIQDNNLLACSRKHIIRVFDMLRQQNQRIKFSGGLDASLFEDWHGNLLRKIKINEIWFSYDTNSDRDFHKLMDIATLLDDFPQNKKRCYVLIGFGNECIYAAEFRLNKIYELGFLPFAQLYQSTQKKIWSKEWRNLARKWSRPAAYKGGG